MSERNEQPAAEAAKPADDRDAQTRNGRPAADAPSPSAGSSPAETAADTTGEKTAETPAASPQGDPLPDKAASAAEPPAPAATGDEQLADQTSGRTSEPPATATADSANTADEALTAASESAKPETGEQAVKPEPGKSESPSEPSRPGAAKPEPGESDSGQSESGEAASAASETSKPEQTKAETGDSTSDKNKSDERESGQSESGEAASAASETSKPEQTKAETGDSTSDKNKPDERESGKAEPVAAASGPVVQEAAEETGEEEAAEEVRRYDCTVPEQRAAGLADAATAIRQGKLVVIPTDTVYGIGADAFTPSAVNALLAAKGRGRDMPVPVLVGTVRAANALVDDLGPHGQDLIDAFWPGPLTIICHAGRSLRWDLGDTKGTVAVRMPLHAVALELLKETGPMAVSSANRSGAPPATTAAEAEEQLGASVAVYLDGGPCIEAVPSTIVDLTTPVPRVLRKGAIPVEKLKNIVGYVATDE